MTVDTLRSGFLDPVSFSKLARIVHEDCGIVLGESKRNLVVSRLTRRLRDLGIDDFDSYCALLDSDDGPAERRRMTSLLTTNVTRFFREPHHFDALEREVLPPLIARARSGGRVRLWSAGCSSGQEPYSIGMVVLDLLPQAEQHDIRILATDIDPKVIEVGRAGRYRDATDAEFTAARRQKFLPTQIGEDLFEVSEPLRRLVQFGELNLMEKWPMKGQFDVIFCRNVVIYFDRDTQVRLWPRFADALRPGGRLFVGHSERVIGPAEPLLEPVGVTQYRRVGPPHRNKGVRM